jgi:hypothetical protein
MERAQDFTHLLGESIDAMFQRFTVIVNNMRANVTVLPYDDHDKVVKLQHSLDCTVWSEKVEAILESSKYETLTVKYFPCSSRPRWTVGCVQRLRTRLTLRFWLSCPDQGLMLTCLRDIFFVLSCVHAR